VISASLNGISSALRSRGNYVDGSIAYHPAKTRTYRPKIIFGHPEPFVCVIKFCCEPRVFAPVAIRCFGQFVDPSAKRLS
jgi:hypothetical protein